MPDSVSLTGGPELRSRVKVKPVNQLKTLADTYTMPPPAGVVHVRLRWIKHQNQPGMHVDSVSLQTAEVIRDTTDTDGKEECTFTLATACGAKERTGNLRSPVGGGCGAGWRSSQWFRLWSEFLQGPDCD